MSENIYLWYSKGSQESATILADLLGIENAGTLPPRNFAGVCINFGGKHTAKFKWEDRNFQAILNDPREKVDVSDRRVMFETLSSAGLDTLTCVGLLPEAQYANICNALGADLAEGFVACKASGTSAKHISNQADLQAAIEAGLDRAVDAKFLSESRLRVFVVNDQAIGAMKKAPASDADFAAYVNTRLSGALGPRADAGRIQTILEALKLGLITKVAGLWQHSPRNAAKLTNIAVAASTALGYGFAAVDLLVSGKTVEVLNVVTTPNLAEAKPLHKSLTDALQAWIASNTMTSKELLLSMIGKMSDEEADALRDELRTMKKNLTAAE